MYILFFYFTFLLVLDTLFDIYTAYKYSKECNYNCEKCKKWDCQYKKCQYNKNKKIKVYFGERDSGKKIYKEMKSKK